MRSTKLAVLALLAAASIAPATACDYVMDKHVTASAPTETAQPPVAQAEAPAAPAPAAATSAETQTAATPVATPGQPKAN